MTPYRGFVLIAALGLLLGCGEDEASVGAGGQAGAHHQHEDAAPGGGGLASGGGSGASGTGGSVAEAGPEGAAGAAPVVCTLGTMYPQLTVIDPDAPVYSDATFTQATVSDMFAKAKAESSMAYLGYRAARDYAHVLDCAFCSCGCAPSIGHLSAIDCFKDMHGFA